MDPHESRRFRDLSPVLRAFKIGGIVFVVAFLALVTLGILDLTGVL